MSHSVTLRRLPWWALGLSVVVLLSAAFAADPLRDAATFQSVPEVHLVLSAGYVLLAPVCDVFDTLSLMSVPQHIAIVVSLLVLFAGWRAWRARRRPTTLLRETGAAALALVGVVALYAAAVLVPRPMAALAVQTPLNDVVLVADFHSHTTYSHDGAPWFSPEANRRWHADAGYDVAYVTDHRTVRGAAEGIAANPAEAGQGTMLLQGLEVVWDGAHVNILGAERGYRGLTDPNLRDVDDTALTLASMLRGHEPIVIFTFPGLLRHLHAAQAPGTPGARAIEIVDGSPRGLTDTRRKRTVIATIADTFNLALVSGTDNHGWGYTAPAWTLVQLPGWRGMGTDSLAASIDEVIRTRGFTGTEVIERRQANTAVSPLRLAATLPLVAARMFTMLSDNERVSWLIWIWALVLIRFAWRRRRSRPGAAAA
ncbi:MAG: hypothetical protein KGL93_14400 [Gemmatimonadota bacterium]|nr:hypothetical protein [Gemmatimonadota bacterium]